MENEPNITTMLVVLGPLLVIGYTAALYLVAVLLTCMLRDMRKIWGGNNWFDGS